MSGEDHHWRRIKSFLQLAEEEFSASQLLLESNPRQAAFFQQQSVEKLIRAVIEFERIVAGPTHSLGVLTDLLGKDHAMRDRFREFDDLSSAAARFRYPSGHGSIPAVTSETLSKKQSDIGLLAAEVKKFIGPLKNG
jgi:HEPN domain-containing protein